MSDVLSSESDRYIYVQVYLLHTEDIAGGHIEHHEYDLNLTWEVLGVSHRQPYIG